MRRARLENRIEAVPKPKFPNCLVVFIEEKEARMTTVILSILVIGAFFLGSI